MPLVTQDAFQRAVDNISSWGDTDVFPFPIENHVLHDKADEVVGLLTTISADLEGELARNPPINHSALAPLGYNGFRWATQIDPIWNACFLGTVLSMAEQIEAARIPESQEIIFSHRLRVPAPTATKSATSTESATSPAANESLFDREGWSKFQEKSRELASESEFVVAVDIADFYSRIYHHRLENQLKYLEPSGGRARHIMQMIGAFSGNVSYGLPVGGPAARILSELLLSQTDRLIQTQLSHIRFVRYADDFRFFAASLEEAYGAVGYLSEKLQRNEGLSLQRHKTRILTSSEFLSTLRPEDPRSGSAAKFLSLHLYYDPYSQTAEEDYERLQSQLDEFDVLGLLRAELIKGRVDISLTRRLVGVLKLMDPVSMEQAVISLLDNLEILTPVVPHVMRAIRENVAMLSPEAQEIVVGRIRGLIESGDHIAQVDVNLSYMIRVLAQSRSQASEELFIKLFPGPHGYAQNPAPNIQRDIILALSRWEANYWLHDQKQHFTTMHSWARRAFIVGSFVMGDEGAHWRQAMKNVFTPFERVISGWTADRKQSGTWEIPL